MIVKTIKFSAWICVVMMAMASCQPVDERFEVASPDGAIDVYFILDNGKPFYQVFYNDTMLVDTSALGLLLKGDPSFTGPFSLEEVTISAGRWGRWKPQSGQQQYLYDKYNQTDILLSGTGSPSRQMKIVFKVYNYGVGISYRIPEQPDLEEIIIEDDIIQVHFTGDHSTWWPVHGQETPSLAYRKTRLSELDRSPLPVLMETPGLKYILVEEANGNSPPEVEYISQGGGEHSLGFHLSANDMSVELPYQSTWRVIQITADPADLALSTMPLNLNRPEQDRDEERGENESEVPHDQQVKKKRLTYNSRIHQLTPEQTCVLPFLDGLVSPVDYTPMTMVDLKKIKHEGGSIARQLAMMIVFYNVNTMDDDLLDKYEDHPGFKLIREIPSKWDRTRVPEAQIGNYIAVARKYNDDWYLGAITDEKARELIFPLDFLDEEVQYEASFYEDGVQENLEAPGILLIRKTEFSSTDTLKIMLSPGSGIAIELKNR